MYKRSTIYSACREIFAVVTVCCLLVSCSFPGLLESSSFDSNEVSSQKATIAMRMTETEAADNAPTSTPLPPTVTPTSEIQCAFVWTLKQDDDLSVYFRSKLAEEQRASTGLGVVWYGENCIDMDTNTLIRFYPANLDITVMFEGDEEKSKQWLGDQIQMVMKGIADGLLERPDLEDFPIMLHFVYAIDGKNTYLEFDLATYRRMNPDAIITGEELFNILFN